MYDLAVSLIKWGPLELRPQDFLLRSIKKKLHHFHITYCIYYPSTTSIFDID